MSRRSLASVGFSRGVLGCLLFGMIFLVFQPAHAQVANGTISGTVKDSSGAVVAGATVTATNRERGIVRTMQTGPDGYYKFTAVPVGLYDVKADMTGFQSQTQENLNLAVGQEAVLNFTMTVGTVQESVTVSAAAPLVETTSGSLGGLVNEQRMSDLPLNGRNYNQLVLLQTGITVHRPISSTSSTSIGLAFSSNGAPIRSNYMTLDGAVLNSGGGITGVSLSGSMLGVDAVREFRVITNNFSAEYGMTMGSQMVIVSKGGTNQIHGTAFDFLRNNALDANNFFQNANNQPIAAFRHNNFGGSIGGAIKKDKTFWFGAYEGVRESKGISELLNVPSLAVHLGTWVPSGATAPATINPLVRPWLDQYPLPNGVLANDPTAKNGIATYAYSFGQPTREDYFQVRFDHNFSEKNQLFVRYTFDDTAIVSPASGFPQFTWNKNSRGQFVTVAENHVFSPSVLNTARLSYSRPFQGFNSPSPLNLSFLQGQQYGMGTIAISGGMSNIGPTLTNPNFFDNNLGTFADDLSWVKDKHSLKIGLLINRDRDFIWTDNFRRGNMNFSNLQSFLAGTPNQMQVLFANSVTDRTFVWNTIGMYAQDDWRVLPRLTLNLGMRYEFQTTTDEVTGRGSAVRDLYHDSGPTLGAALYKNPSLKNFGPRFGFAWDVNGDGKTAVRGGFGIFYDIGQITGAADIETTSTPPFSGSTILTPATGLRFPNLTPIPGASSAGPLALRTIEYTQSQPHMLSYNFSVQRELPGSMAITIAYAGSKGISLTGTIEGDPSIPQIINGREFWPAAPPLATCLAAPGTPGCRVNPAFNSCECKVNGLDSWYNSLQVQLQKRLTKNVQFQVSYTFAKALDDTQGQHGGEAGGSNVTGTDPGHLGTDKGQADFNVPHYFIANTLYALPSPSSGVAKWLLGGWRTGTIFTAQSGLPFTAYVTQQRSRSGVLGNYTSSGNPDRPNMIPGCNLILGGVNQYFNPACFAVQPVGFLGSAGRNIMNGPREINWDFSLTKETPLKLLGEAGKLEFRAEIFNILNHASFAIPGAGPTDGRVVYTGTATAASTTPLATAGQIGRTVTEPREIQFALKLIF